MKHVQVFASSRLHFGLLRLQEEQRRSFGGVGMMIDSPGWELEIAPASQLQIEVVDAEPVRRLVDRVADAWNIEATLACRITVLRSAPPHIGLGTGTQRNLAIVAGLARFFDRAPLGTEELAFLADRGRRSAVGTHGFFQGGFLVDGGFLPAEPLGQLHARVEVPDNWRILLVSPPESQGLSGAQEQQAFDTLTSSEEDRAPRLASLVEEQMLPALREGNCAAFGEAVYQYGAISGEYFIAAQGGIFANCEVAETIEQLRREGVAGVGQSSWGPSIYAILPDAERAAEVRQLLREIRPNWSTHIAKPQNRGAQIKTSYPS